MFKPTQLVPTLPGWYAVFKNPDATLVLPVSCWVLMADNYSHRIEGVVQDPEKHCMIPISEVRLLDYQFSNYDYGEV